MGKVGFFPSKYVAKLHPGERALQVVHPIQVAEQPGLGGPDNPGGPGGSSAKLVRDQVHLFVLPLIAGLKAATFVCNANKSNMTFWNNLSILFIRHYVLNRHFS